MKDNVMKKMYFRSLLFFGMAILSALIWCKPLLANEIDVQIANSLDAQAGDEIDVQPSIMCDSPVGQDVTYANIILNNEESEAFYARKNFRESVYFIVKIAIAVGVVVGICGLFVWCINSCNINHVTHEHLITHQHINENLITALPQQEVRDVEVLRQDNGYTVEIEQLPGQGAQGQLQNFEPISNRVIGIWASSDVQLCHDVANQIEQARTIGLVPAQQTWNNDEFVGRPMRDSRKFNQLITEQIEHARQIGLIPADL